MLLMLSLACQPNNSDVRVEPWLIVESYQNRQVPSAMMDAFEEQRVELDVPGVAFAVLKDGDLLYAGATGVRDLATNEPMLADTLMRGASLIKMQTATALLVQEQAGLLSMEDTVGEHLPAFRMDRGTGQLEAATLHQLVSHQAGAFNYIPVDGPNRPATLYNHAHGAYADMFWPSSRPGALYNYSNANFSFAGLVAQEASGVPFAELLEATVWEPLGMTRTFFDAEDVFEDGNYAVGEGGAWDLRPEGPVYPDSYDHGFTRPAAMGWTNVIDLARFGHFLMEGHPEVLAADGHRALSRPYVDTHWLPDGEEQYGYGLFVSESFRDDEVWKEGPVWTHGGNMPGFGADLFVLPDEGLVVAVMSNGNHAHFRTAIRTVVRELVDVPDDPTPPDYTVSEADLDAVVGDYIDPWQVGPIRVTRSADGLRIVAPALDQIGVPYDRELIVDHARVGSWSLDGGDRAVAFVPDASGTVRYLRNRNWVAERVSASNQGLSTTVREWRPLPDPGREPGPDRRAFR